MPTTLARILPSETARSGGRFLVPVDFGTDDFIELTITDLDGFGVYQDLDFNDAYGRWDYTQNVTFGLPEDAPDVLRQHPALAEPPNKKIFIDEQRAFENIFTVAGDYRSDFSFHNKYSSSACHPDIYLLIAHRWPLCLQQVNEPVNRILARLMSIVSTRRIRSALSVSLLRGHHSPNLPGSFCKPSLASRWL